MTSRWRRLAHRRGWLASPSESFFRGAPFRGRDLRIEIALAIHRQEVLAFMYDFKLKTYEQFRSIMSFRESDEWVEAHAENYARCLAVSCRDEATRTPSETDRESLLKAADMMDPDLDRTPYL